jgi:hypothetical protein
VKGDVDLQVLRLANVSVCCLWMGKKAKRIGGLKLYISMVEALCIRHCSGVRRSDGRCHSMCYLRYTWKPGDGE